MLKSRKNTEKQKEPLKGNRVIFGYFGPVQQLGEHSVQVQEAQIVKEVFEMYSKEGRSIEEVCESLNLKAPRGKNSNVSN